jgi:hypothetical protein
VLTIPARPDQLAESGVSGSSSVWRARLRPALVVLLVAGVLEWLLWWFFLTSTYYRRLFYPLALLVAVVALVALARTLRPRGGERRADERRQGERRDDD